MIQFCLLIDVKVCNKMDALIIVEILRFRLSNTL